MGDINALKCIDGFQTYGLLCVLYICTHNYCRYKNICFLCWFSCEGDDLWYTRKFSSTSVHCVLDILVTPWFPRLSYQAISLRIPIHATPYLHILLWGLDIKSRFYSGNHKSGFSAVPNYVCCVIKKYVCMWKYVWILQKNLSLVFFIPIFFQLF